MKKTVWLVLPGFHSGNRFYVNTAAFSPGELKRLMALALYKINVYQR